MLLQKDITVRRIPGNPDESLYQYVVTLRGKDTRCYPFSGLYHKAIVNITEKEEIEKVTFCTIADLNESDLTDPNSFIITISES